MGKTLVEMAAEIVQSQCGTTSMTTDEISQALQNTFKVLQGMQNDETLAVIEGAETVETQKTAVSPEKSILKNKIICLECGQEFKMLSPKHLKSHGLNGREY